MWAYEQAYGYTRLRLLVSVCEGWLGLVFVLVLVGRGTAAGTLAAAGRRWPRPRWPCSGWSRLNPDLLIAQQNVRGTRRPADRPCYLRDLSADAVPALERLPNDLRDCALR